MAWMDSWQQTQDRSLSVQGGAAEYRGIMGAAPARMANDGASRPAAGRIDGSLAGAQASTVSADDSATTTTRLRPAVLAE
jgi:hypothetical protein